MMRLARTASLLVAFSLLTSAATTHAESAWVLWKSTTSVYMAPQHAYGTKTFGLAPVINTAWEPQAAHETNKACEDALAAEQRRLRAAGADPKLVCLPDTVDPRGPKGK